MSHFLTLVSTDRDNLYDYLERFCEQTEDMDYLEFYDETERWREAKMGGYETSFQKVQ